MSFVLHSHVAYKRKRVINAFRVAYSSFKKAAIFSLKRFPIMWLLIKNHVVAIVHNLHIPIPSCNNT